MNKMYVGVATATARNEADIPRFLMFIGRKRGMEVRNAIAHKFDGTPVSASEFLATEDIEFVREWAPVYGITIAFED